MNKTAALRGLYGINSADLLMDHARLEHAVTQALQGGMSILQYRDKSPDFARKSEQAGRLRSLCRRYGALLIINDDVDLAKHVGADGVHLGSGDASIPVARSLLGESAIIGYSCYNRLHQARQAKQQGADYVAFGSFFASRTKPQAVTAATDLLRQARRTLNHPTCAIGGITVDNARPLIEQGADMIAVIQGLFSADDIEQRARELSALFN